MPWRNRSAELGVALLALLMLLPAVARADGPGPETEPPLSGGIMDFPAIRSATDPEEFSWHVRLEEGQKLRQINDQEVAAYFDGEHLALDFFAEPAHDAIGATVPTAVKLVGENVVTLVVHHREGNPAAGGTPFTYPVTSGEGWNGGFGTYFVPMPPPETAPTPPDPEPNPVPTCQVPDLHGATLDSARRRLRRSHCRLGSIAKAPRLSASAGRVVRQRVTAGTTLVSGAKVDVRLGPPPVRRRG